MSDELTLYEALDNPDDIEHYGRKGMKWGQHIFQKMQKGAASLKKSGMSAAKLYEKYKGKAVNFSNARTDRKIKKVRSRIAELDKKQTLAELKAQEKAKRIELSNSKERSKPNKQATPGEKPISEMSDAELKRRTQRLQLEQAYRNALPKSPSSKPPGQKFIEKALEGAANGTQDLARGATKVAGAKFLSEVLGDSPGEKRAIYNSLAGVQNQPKKKKSGNNNDNDEDKDD